MIAMATEVTNLLAGEAFNGDRILENTVRLVTLIVGFPIGLVFIKFGWASLRKGQPDRGWGTLSYAFMLLVPAVGRAMSFGNPVNWVTTGIYTAGLITAGIALGYRGRWKPRRRRPAQENTDE